MIYGYDDRSQTLYIADFFENNYAFATATYKEMREALNFEGKEYTHFWMFHDDIIMMKACHDTKNIFSPRRVKVSLEDYMNALPSAFTYTRIREQTPTEMAQYVFGKDCYKILYRHIEYSLETNELRYFWSHSFHLMAEHKKVMCERIKFMGNNGFLNNHERYLNEYLHLSEEQKLCENLYIKYVITRKNMGLEKLRRRIQKVEKEESDVLKDLVSDIIEK